MHRKSYPQSGYIPASFYLNPQQEYYDEGGGNNEPITSNENGIDMVSPHNGTKSYWHAKHPLDANNNTQIYPNRVPVTMNDTPMSHSRSMGTLHRKNVALQMEQLSAGTVPQAQQQQQQQQQQRHRWASHRPMHHRSCGNLLSAGDDSGSVNSAANGVGTDTLTGGTGTIGDYHYLNRGRGNEFMTTTNPRHAGIDCDIGNCGKLLWITRDGSATSANNGDNGAATKTTTPSGKTRSRENIIIRTNAQGLPYTPLPSQRSAYLANQHAIEAAIPIVCGTRRRKSPNRYVEGDVNIHYKTPIRYEYKDRIPDEELAIRQAESMQKLYQEERRRKYLQELQDMNSRRHTDNFTPSQKSPIPLNRYDDFNSDLAAKSPSYPRTVARALYNFQGQTPRELTFKKGDVIYIRRQIDKNWYEGEHNAMIGLLPSNYVEIFSRDSVRQPPKKPAEGQARAKYNFQAQSAIELSLNKGELVTLTRRVDENWFEGKIANRKGIFPVTYVEVLVDIGVEDRATAANRVPASQSIITQQSSTAVRPSLDTLRTNINNEFNSLTSNGQHPNGILRETKNLHKTEVLHVDTNTEPVAYRAMYKYRPQNTDELELLEGDIVYVLEKCDDGWFVGTSQRTGCFGTFPDAEINQILGVFLENLIQRKKQEYLYPCLLPTVSQVISAPYESPLHEIKPETILRFVIDATRPQFCTPGADIHNKLALSFLHEMQNNIANKDLCKILSKELLTLELSVKEDLKFKEESKGIAEKLIKCEFDGKTLKNIVDFKDMLDGVFKPALRHTNLDGSDDEDKSDDETVSAITTEKDFDKVSSSNVPLNRLEPVVEEEKESEQEKITENVTQPDLEKEPEPVPEKAISPRTQKSNKKRKGPEITINTEKDSEPPTDVASTSTISVPAPTPVRPAASSSTPGRSTRPSATPTTFGRENSTELRYLRKSLNFIRQNTTTEDGPSPKIRIEARIDSIPSPPKVQKLDDNTRSTRRNLRSVPIRTNDENTPSKQNQSAKERRKRTPYPKAKVQQSKEKDPSSDDQDSDESEVIPPSPTSSVATATSDVRTMGRRVHRKFVSTILNYRAMYKYRPQNTDELELLEGDIVYVLEKCDDGWFVGTSQRTGCFGTFPGNYVERV